MNKYLLFQLLWDGVYGGAVYAVMSFGFALIYFTTRILHFAHGAVAILMSYCVYLLASVTGLPWPYAAAIAVPIGFAVGAVFEICFYGVLRRRGGTEALPGGAYFVVSLGLALLITNLLPIFFGSAPKYVGGGPLADSVLVWGNRIALTHISLVVVPASIVVLGLALGWLRFSDYGQTIRAVIDDVNTATIVGISVPRVNVVVLGLGSALAVGVATVQLLSAGANSQLGNNLILATIAAAVIGGVGSLPGAVLGGFLVGIVSNVALIKMPTSWGSGTIYVLLLAVIAVRPQGLLGKRSVQRA